MPTEKQLEYYEAYKRLGGIRAVAREKRVNYTTARSHIKACESAGLPVSPGRFHPHTPIGHTTGKVTTQVSYRNEEDGTVVTEWVRSTPSQLSPEELAEYLESRIPVSSLDVPVPENCNESLMLEWPIYDAHHGMLAWAKETGNDYDTKISRHLQVSAANILYGCFGKVAQTTIVFGGDNQTSDNRQGKTEKSGHIVDTDSRYQKIAWCTYEAAFASIDIAAHFSKKVLVIVLPGNHDNDSSVHLAISLHAHYRNCPNIEVNDSPARHKFYSWGRNVFMGTHGELSAKSIAPFALQQAIRKGYATDPEMRLYVRMGHLHKREKTVPDLLTEQDGVVVERFPTLAGQEAYSIEGAYTSCRATSANLWHHKYGKINFREITVGEILERFPLAA